jgi:hypothetical protein
MTLSRHLRRVRTLKKSIPLIKIQLANLCPSIILKSVTIRMTTKLEFKMKMQSKTRLNNASENMMRSSLNPEQRPK